MGVKKGRMFWIVGLIVVVVGVAVFATTSDVTSHRRERQRKGKTAKVEKVRPEHERTSSVRVTRRAVEKNGYVAVRQLTTNPDEDEFPSWSPDGQWIVYHAYDEELSEYGYGIFKINVAGTGLTPLAIPDDDYQCFSKPMWSPEGSKILYQGYGDTAHAGGWYASTFIMDPDGSNRERVSPDSEYCRSYANWSADGNMIVCKHQGSEEGLSILDLDTGIETELPTGDNPWVYLSDYPKFSPDGSKILFKDYDEYLCVVDVTGENWSMIDENCQTKSWDWSPDGEKVVYNNDQDGDVYLDIWVADLEGNTTPILEGDECFQEVDWQPVSAKAEGKWIVYSKTEEDGEYDYKNTWVVTTDGLYTGCLHSAPTQSYGRTCPTWSYQGDKIVFCSDWYGEDDDYNIFVIDLDTDDNDEDDLMNWEEWVAYGTDPEDADTDGGGESDGSEIENGRDPLDPDDDVAINLHDICAVAITVPADTLIKLHAYTPAAVVRNDGPTPESFRAYLKVVKDGHLVYTAFVTVGNMPGGATDTVYFSPNWVPRQVGGYTSEFIVQSELDKNPANNVCSGQLWVKDISGPMSSAGTKVFFLDQNAPNPMHERTSIRFQIPQATYVSLKIYDTSGRLVRTLVNETKQPGDYTVSWDGKDTSGKRVAHGVYLYEIKAGKYESHKKIIVQ